MKRKLKWNMCSPPLASLGREQPRIVCGESKAWAYMRAATILPCVEQTIAPSSVNTAHAYGRWNLYNTEIFFHLPLFVWVSLDGLHCPRTVKNSKYTGRLKRTANIRTGAIYFKTRPQFCFALLIVMGLDTAKYLTKEDICQGHQ